MKFKINDRVISRGNDDQPYQIGTFQGYSDDIKSNDDIPIILFDGQKEPHICFGMTIPYSVDMIDRLDVLTPEQQYELLWTIHNWKSGHQLIIMRGCPGSGKSTKARRLAGQSGQVFSTDDYFVDASGNYNWNGNELGKAHKWNQRRSLAAMKANIPIVVIDNTNTTLREIRSYMEHIELARQLGYTVSIEEPETSWKFDLDELVELNTHGVPKEAIQRMLDRYAKDVKVEDVLFIK